VFLLAHRTVFVLLLTAVLAIGGCLPCQQLISGETPKKSCCNSRGECQKPGPDNPTKKACNLQLRDAQSEPQQQSDRLIDGTLPTVAEVEAPVSRVAYAGVSDIRTSSFDSSPPPLFLRNLSLLI
jgi:hypothetical protein